MNKNANLRRETLGNGAARIATGVSEGEAPIAPCQAISDEKIACPLIGVDRKRSAHGRNDAPSAFGTETFSRLNDLLPGLRKARGIHEPSLGERCVHPEFE